MNIQDDNPEKKNQTLRTYFCATNRAAAFSGMTEEQRQEVLAAIDRDERLNLIWGLIEHISRMFGLPAHSVIKEEAQADGVALAERKRCRDRAARSARAHIAAQFRKHRCTSEA